MSIRPRTVGVFVSVAIAIAAFAGSSSSARGDSPGSIEESWYDYRTNPAYDALSEDDRVRLEQVTHDFVLLWGALDMYADRRGGDLPDSLDDLVPRFLRRLPLDPFVTEENSGKATRAGYVPSADGHGYLYRRGAPGNRAWIVASVGLPQFPYLAERGNIGLGQCKGTWISGINPRRFKGDR